MRLTMAERLIRLVLATGLALAVLLPAALPVAAIVDDNTLRLGTTQAMDATNPYQATLVESYEAFELTATSSSASARTSSRSRPLRHPGTGPPTASRGRSSSGRPQMVRRATGHVGRRLLLVAAEPRRDQGWHRGRLRLPDPGIKDAGVTKVECPDATTMIVSTEDNTNRILQTYVPILPKHIYGKMDYKKLGDDPFTVPADGSGLVGTGAYQIVEYKVNEFARFKRNPNYWGEKGAPDEIVMQFFSTHDTLFQALKKGEIDYARKLSPEQFKQLQSDPAITTVAGKSNGWTELGFNTYGTGTGKTIKGGGPSTKALQDPKFRDALGYAIDKQKLVDNVIGGLGTIGSTQIPPVMKDGNAGIDWHADPTTPRTFDIELAKQKLTDAGYVARRVRPAARQGRQADQPQAGPPRLRPELRQGRPVHQGLVRRTRDQGDRQGL